MSVFVAPAEVMDRRDNEAPKPIGRGFVALVAFTMATSALAIDGVLAAFPALRVHVGLPADSAKIGLVVTVYMLGLGIGQPIAGPLSDAYGRRAVSIGGALIALVAVLIAIWTSSLTGLLFARLLWGIGAAGPRTAATAMIRDTFVGDRMAQVLSYSMSVFMIVPVIAPAIGKGALQLGGWRLALGFPGFALAVLVFLMWRTAESLAPQNRRPFSTRAIRDGFREVGRTRSTMLFATASGFVFGSATAYLSVIEQIIDDTYHRGSQFPLIFGAIAALMTASTLLNARLVGNFGLDTMLKWMPRYTFGVGTSVLAVSLLTHGHPPLLLFAFLMVLMLSGQMMVMPNVNTAAMIPVGHLAGVASGVTGTITMLLGASLGIIVASVYSSGTTVLGAAQSLFYGIALLLVARARRASSTALV
jgi:MFS transporter, DHA1 family, multidrug resistance protein